MWSEGHFKEVTLEFRPEYEKKPQGSSGKQRGQQLQSVGLGTSPALLQGLELW